MSHRNKKEKRVDAPRKKDSEKTSSDLKPTMALLIVSLVIFESLVTMTVIGSASVDKEPLKGAIDSLGK